MEKASSGIINMRVADGGNRRTCRAMRSTTRPCAFVDVQTHKHRRTRADMRVHTFALTSFVVGTRFSGAQLTAIPVYPTAIRQDPGRTVDRA